MLLSACEKSAFVEESCVLQAKYHQKRFCTYPHVNSPAKLIEELLKPGGDVAELQQV